MRSRLATLLFVLTACSGGAESVEAPTTPRPASSPSPTATKPASSSGDRSPTKTPSDASPIQAAAEEPEAPLSRGEVILVPLKSFPDDLLEEVETTLQRELHVTIRVLDPQPLPKDAYYKPRRRYRADTLIEHLLTFTRGQPATTRVLGLTEVDISTTKGDIKDWGIFGLGYCPGRSAVVSSHRLERKAKRDKVRFRVANTALHEIGHTFGLEHCTEERCPMQDAHGSIENTDSSTGHLGPGCQAKLDAATKALAFVK